MAHIDRYLERCTSIEDDECIVSEEFLKKARSEGAANLDIIENTSKEIPDMPGDIEAEHAWEVLENRRRASKQSEGKRFRQSARSRLYEINEETLTAQVSLTRGSPKSGKEPLQRLPLTLKVFVPAASHHSTRISLFPRSLLTSITRNISATKQLRLLQLYQPMRRTEYEIF